MSRKMNQATSGVVVLLIIMAFIFIVDAVVKIIEGVGYGTVVVIISIGMISYFLYKIIKKRNRFAYFQKMNKKEEIERVRREVLRMTVAAKIEKELREEKRRREIEIEIKRKERNKAAMNKKNLKSDITDAKYAYENRCSKRKQLRNKYIDEVLR